MSRKRKHKWANNKNNFDKGTNMTNYNGGYVNGKPYSGYTSYTKIECHTGNHAIIRFSRGTEKLGTLWAGGWTRGAKPKAGWVVIDLADYGLIDNIVEDNTGGLFPSVKQLSSVKVLKLGIADFGIPDFKPSFWLEFSEDVKAILSSGTDVLVACTGGHGRTGLVISILAGLLLPDSRPDPIAWLRKMYCASAVETFEQEQYVDGVLNCLLNGGPADFVIEKVKTTWTGTPKTNLPWDDGDDPWAVGTEMMYGKTRKFDDKGNDISDNDADGDDYDAYMSWLKLNSNHGG